VTGDAPVDLAPVRAAVRKALGPYRLPSDTAVAIVFVDDTAMRALNDRFRNRDRTTDVLSFGQTIDPSAKGASAVPLLRREVDGTLDLGDIVISAGQARRQARRKGHPLWREIAFLAAHGALHLVGFEDESRQGYREMVALGAAALRGVTRK
jgi:probable rRNA maturation factor